jgi:hypothetical protein
MSTLSPQRTHAEVPGQGRFPDSVLTTKQLASLIGVSVRKLERDRQDGTGVPYIKFGRRVFYRGADVETFLQSNSFTSTAEARRVKEGL